jgi:2-polyprenyl-3-methyl-5-hydroxy-6-metoxy-1,4-benzoquinol methylase
MTLDPTLSRLPKDLLERLAGSGAFQEGLARQSYLDHPLTRELYSHLEAYQNEFLATDKRWRPELPWPRDALGWWSRRWEYVYAFFQGMPTAGESVLDAGSGITFFPFYMRSNGLKVSCCDLDDALIPAFRDASQVLGQQVDFRTADLAELPYGNAEFDTVYCISVLEHTTQWEKIVGEFRRVIRPGGKLVLTLDVELSNPDSSYSVGRITQLLAVLDEAFRLPRYRPVSDIPEDALTTHARILEKAELSSPDIKGLGDALNFARHPRRYAWARQRLANEPNLAVFCITARRPMD